MQEKVGDTTSAVGECEYMMLCAGMAERLYVMVEVLFCSFCMRKPEAERIRIRSKDEIRFWLNCPALKERHSMLLRQSFHYYLSI